MTLQSNEYADYKDREAQRERIEPITGEVKVHRTTEPAPPVNKPLDFAAADRRIKAAWIRDEIFELGMIYHANKGRGSYCWQIAEAAKGLIDKAKAELEELRK